jgi:hypothetical protein
MIRLGVALPVDEVDLGPGAALLSPEVANRLLPGEPEPEPEPEPEASEEDGRRGGATTAARVGGRRVELSIRATKDDLFTINKALSQLRDMLGDAGEMSIDIQVQADTAANPIDPIRLQNMVLQHLEEDPDVTFDHRLE